VATSTFQLPAYYFPTYYLQAEAPERTRDGFEATIGINHLGHFCLASLLQPLLAADGGGRRVATLSLTPTLTLTPTLALTLILTLTLSLTPTLTLTLP